MKKKGSTKNKVLQKTFSLTIWDDKDRERNICTGIYDYSDALGRAHQLLYHNSTTVVGIKYSDTKITDIPYFIKMLIIEDNIIREQVII